MLERQPRFVQDGIENAPMPTAEISSSKKVGTESAVILSIDVQGLGPWRGLGQRPNLTCFIGRWFGAGVSPTRSTNPAKRVRGVPGMFDSLGMKVP
jgi:hypothetical protein